MYIEYNFNGEILRNHIFINKKINVDNLNTVRNILNIQQTNKQLPKLSDIQNLIQHCDGKLVNFLTMGIGNHAIIYLKRGSVNYKISIGLFFDIFDGELCLSCLSNYTVGKVVFDDDDVIELESTINENDQCYTIKDFNKFIKTINDVHLPSINTSSSTKSLTHDCKVFSMLSKEQTPSSNGGYMISLSWRYNSDIRAENLYDYNVFMDAIDGFTIIQNIKNHIRTLFKVVAEIGCTVISNYHFMVAERASGGVYKESSKFLILNQIKKHKPMLNKVVDSLLKSDIPLLESMTILEYANLAMSSDYILFDDMWMVTDEDRENEVELRPMMLDSIVNDILPPEELKDIIEMHDDAIILDDCVYYKTFNSMAELEDFVVNRNPHSFEVCDSRIIRCLLGYL